MDHPCHVDARNGWGLPGLPAVHSTQALFSGCLCPGVVPPEPQTVRGCPPSASSVPRAMLGVSINSLILLGMWNCGPGAQMWKLRLAVQPPRMVSSGASPRTHDMVMASALALQGVAHVKNTPLPAPKP